MEPSTIDNGFILSAPPLENPYLSDPSYQRVVAWYLPPDVLKTVESPLAKFAEEAVSPETNELISNAERELPYIKTHNVWGGRYPYDRLVTSQGWKGLGKWGAKNGVIALGYEEEFGSYRRLVQHSFNYTYSASSAAFSCPVSMTSGAARLVSKHLPNLPPTHPFHDVFKRLTARSGNWISSQWMTERPGGSDVRNSETMATYSPLTQKTGEFGNIEEGDYLVSGFKFFCSATDCNMVLALAKTKGGSGQLSLFLAPVRKTVIVDGKPQEVSNGIRIHRLKNKMGTKELPTAEVELKNTRAWRIGPVDRGIATIALLLNVTRTHNFITALSCWRRGMAIAKGFAKVRMTLDQPLSTFPMHLRLLANMEIKHRGLLQFAFFTTALLSFVDNGFPSTPPSGYAPLPEPGEQTEVVLRTFTATAKAVICKVSCIALQECQEAMGGVGYMDEPDEPEYNISRLYRDTTANMTWEGTTNVLSSEVVRHLLGKGGRNLSHFSAWLEKAISSIRDTRCKQVLDNAWTQLRRKLSEGQHNLSAILAEGRQIMFTLAWIVGGMLLAADAQRDGNAIATEIAERWILDGDGGVGEFVIPGIVYAAGSGGDARRVNITDQEKVNWDSRLVWGVDLPEGAATGFRSAVASKL